MVANEQIFALSIDVVGQADPPVLTRQHVINQGIIATDPVVGDFDDGFIGDRRAGDDFAHAH